MNYTVVLNDETITEYYFKDVKTVYVGEADYIIYGNDDEVLGAFPSAHVKALIKN